MIPYTYQKMKKFICTNCGNEFESGSPAARYCTLTCQRRAKALRRTKREAEFKPVELTPDTRFSLSITDPSTKQLDTYAQLILAGDINKPVQFFGFIPYWVVPSGITLTEQLGVEPRQWVMMKQEVDIMSEFLNK